MTVAPSSTDPERRLEGQGGKSMFAVELYNREFDWLAASLLVVPLVWLFYGTKAAGVCSIIFLLVGALKPLVAGLGTRLAAGVFAAGIVLLLSPLLRFVMYDGYCHDGAWSIAVGIIAEPGIEFCSRGLLAHVDQGVWLGPLRDLTMPISGLGLILATTPQAHPTDDETGYARFSTGKFSLRRILLPLGLFLLVFAVGTQGVVSWFNYEHAQAAVDEQIFLEMQQRELEAAKAAELAKRADDEASAAATRKQVDPGWLIGNWATVDGLGENPDRSFYCATDGGYMFKIGGKYIGASDEGTFTLKDNVITLSNRTSYEMGYPDAPTEHLPSIDYKVERNGKRLMIDGSTYGRC